MGHIVVDAALPQKLLTCNQPLILCDPSGRVLGRFVPEQFAAYAPKDLKPQISEEELRRREQEVGGRTLAEIMADLEKRRRSTPFSGDLLPRTSWRRFG